MLPFKKLLVIGVLPALFFSRTSAQETSSDTAYLHATLAQAVNNFNKDMGEQLWLYNGHEYLPYDRNIQGNALFPEAAASLVPGEVNYDGFVFKNVPMMYDIFKDEVIVLLYNKFSMYSLLSERVHDFTLLGHHFVRVNTDTIQNDKSGITTGFYDQLYGGGKVELLAKRTKTIQNSSNATIRLTQYFAEKNEYYIRKGHMYYKVGGKGSVLNVLKDKKPALQKYLKDSHIKYGEDEEAAMTQLVSYYDHN